MGTTVIGPITLTEKSNRHSYAVCFVCNKKVWNIMKIIPVTYIVKGKTKYSYVCSDCLADEKDL